MNSKFLVLAATFIIAISPAPVAAQFAGGSGTPGDPYQISTVEQLQAMNTNLNAHYVLINDIDASSTSTWDSGRGFRPISFPWQPGFRGSLDGNGYAITDLYINRHGGWPKGLFGSIRGTGRVHDVTLVDVSVTGSNDIGGLVGFSAWGATITDCSVSGTVTGTDYVGGLAGNNWGPPASITNSHSTAAVVGERWVGGLVGANWDRTNIYDSSASGSVTGIRTVGGLVGQSVWSANIINGHANGTVVGEGWVGGLAGINYRGSRIEDSSTTGTVTGHYLVGGMVGESWNNSAILNSHADCTVTGESRIGGLAGANYGSSRIEDSSAAGSVTGSGVGPDPACGQLGGVAGENGWSSRILNSHSTCSVTGQVAPDDPERALSVGGLVGWNGYDTTIAGSYATGTVSGWDMVGGLVGRNYHDALITTSYATGDVTGTTHVGGLVGGTSASNSEAGCTMSECLATGNVTGTHEVGGLAGNLYKGATVIDCYATGDVNGTGVAYDGIEDPPENIGGLVGAHFESSAIENSYSNGLVSTSHLTLLPLNVGGLIGLREDEFSTVTSSYWDTETSGQSGSDGGTGKTTAEMVQQATFVGWDFVNVWSIADGWTYPYFPWGPVEDVRFPSLMESVMDLVESGDLTHGNGNALNQKLSNAMEHLEEGKTKTACNNLQAFVNQVCGLVEEGALTEEQGEELIEAAHAIMEEIGCERIRGCE